ncbi:MAG: DivIVA domain-containing protein [Candidatus Marinimicrobia bacterium]|mgnify:FL=1|jgi:DivIVA domain-containing protein|nr:DivIVA domain-containing protein [Candidatus Neomarinimicrobiota bacterium]OQC43896.1 MAG: DivIVA protein [Candidatus Marinimicrobia bacterium ADurb.Bin030]HOD37577.1 DivIVA domain-containing protein [Candidatus Neomarinimicrobiota bacterium]HOU16266.1 DivIVA domain-containing protein [Candidatus Neomarinimicrobiota bacterium]HPI27047.1 DivIVA domain-containing protein [Candidatus Neomarinimicrobiota bacterium]
MIKTNEIRDRQFRKVFRGYDPVEVKYFTEMLADEFAQMEEKLEKLEAIVNEFDQTRKGRDKILQEAQDRAASIILDAESIASEVIANAETKKRQIQEAIDQLNLEQNKLIQRLRSVLKNQAEILTWLEEAPDWSEEDNTLNESSEETT